ncbi:MAG: zinc ribbon domain-containing protein [Gemmatimonadota bacterium]|jgi:putative FmdB family regulatory protein|nr:FmdB family transcriptional regulator [Gemmatimonadota bacterium]MDP6529300.1 zinc ribbon domain-containing protein [Gemmatimonadota bacterium]MDP6802185.1 zinc ribbon domain-containing protein [Gemmatimonadota bacterium]MDP7031515.1 zinc ribbon domain-containing protein [Gemmatimonadota bacterium]
MPTYRYECASCEEVREVFHSMSAQPEEDCPDCGGKLRRLIGGGGGVLLKGQGFYTTDYRSDAYRSAQKKDRPPSPDGDKGKKSSGG